MNLLGMKYEHVFFFVLVCLPISMCFRLDLLCSPKGHYIKSGHSVGGGGSCIPMKVVQWRSEASKVVYTFSQTLL